MECCCLKFRSKNLNLKSNKDMVILLLEWWSFLRFWNTTEKKSEFTFSMSRHKTWQVSATTIKQWRDKEHALNVLTIVTIVSRKYKVDNFNHDIHAGEKVYPDEDIRLACPTYIKQLLRKGRSLARQDRDLAMIYSLSLSTSYVLLLADSHKLIPKLPFS